MTSTDEVVDALSKSVYQLDNARRVGWAKSYEAESRLSDLEKDLAIARGDAALLSRLAGILWGFVLETTDGRRHQALEPHIDIGKLTSLLSQSALNMGKRAAADYHEMLNKIRGKAAAYKTETELLVEDLKSGKRDRSSKLMAVARNQEFKRLMRRYGFDSVDDMKGWLALYATRDHPPCAGD